MRIKQIFVKYFNKIFRVRLRICIFFRTFAPDYKLGVQGAHKID